MKNQKTRSLTLLLMTLLLGVSATWLSGCGKDTSEKQCADNQVLVDGVCQEAAVNCGGDDSKCDDGFVCNDDNSCVARIACTSDAQCGGGLCSDKGACVNVGECSSDRSCIPGDICNLTTHRCEPSPCPESCTRGVCNFNSKKCEDSDVCNETTEATLCLEGSKCLGGTCVSGAKFCETETCRGGGVCSPTEFKCVNAENCENNDSKCLPGLYCNQTTCETDACDENGVTCKSERGVCDKASGNCVNPTTCTKSEDCLVNHSCVITVEGEPPVCVPEGQECQDKCHGNQVCQYYSNKKALCEENNEGCKTTVDCLGQRVCISGSCSDNAPACSADDQEPNNDSTDATDFNDKATNHQIKGLTLCENDVDVFKYDLVTSDLNGVFVVTLEMNKEDVGAGEVILKVTDKDNNAKTFSNLKDGEYSEVIQETISFNAASKGVYELEVTTKNLYASGIRYSLHVTQSTTEAVDACTHVQDGVLNNEISGNLQENARLGLKDSCSDTDGNIPKDIWKFTITEESRVDLSTLSSGAEKFIPVVSVRTSCIDQSSELSGACHEAAKSDDAVNMSAILLPGDYFVVISSKEQLTANQGAYTLKVQATPIVCKPGAATCIEDDSKSKRCNEDLTAYQEVDCGTSGCDPASGHCLSDLGNTCGAAIPVTEANHPDRTFDVSLLTEEIHPKGGCPKMSITRSGAGREGVFRVTVPPKKSVEMTVSVVSGSLDLAAYILSDCYAPTTTCIIGSDTTGSEKVKVTNKTDQPQDYYFVADLYGTTKTTGEMKASFAYMDYVCSAGEYSCDSNNEHLQRCRSDETGYDKIKDCGTRGCDPQANRCNPVQGNTCDNPIELESGVKQGPFEFDDVRDATPAPGDCGSITTTQTGGNEFVFKVTTTEANQIIELFVEATATSNPMVWLADGCTNGQLGACLNGVNEETTINKNEYIRYVAAAAGDYYFVVEDAASSSQNTGKFSITAKVQSPTCQVSDAPKCNATGDKIVYCSEVGLPLEYSCACTTGESSCTDKNAKSCFSAKLVNDTTDTSGTVKKTVISSDENNLSFSANDDTGQCRFKNEGNFSGSDLIYRFNLLVGQVLSVDFKAENNRFTTIAYFVEKCGDMSTCKGTLRNGDQKLSYVSANGGDVFLVIDSKASSYKFSFDWSIEDKACSPGQSQCTPGNNTSVSICNASGIAWKDYPCPANQTCEKGTCVDSTTPYVNDTCANAIELTNNGTFVAWDSSVATDDSSSSCATTYGSDIFYKVNALQGQIIEVEVFSIGSAYPSVYIFDDCANINQCVASAEGSYSDPTGHVTARFVAPENKTYYIALDNKYSSNKDLNYARIEVTDPECSSNDTPVCDSTKVKYCEDSRWKWFDCGNAGTCTPLALGAECSTKTGDTCFDAIPIDLTTTTQGTFTDQKFTNKTNFSKINFKGYTAAVDSCVFYGEPKYEDFFYSVKLQKGDLFTAKLSKKSSNKLQLYAITGDCSKYECVASDPLNSSYGSLARQRVVSFIAEKTQTYYIVVDLVSEDKTAKFDLDWKVVRNSTTNVTSCEPFTSFCDDAQGPNVIQICNAEGTAFIKGECPNGCENTQCKVDQSLMTKFDTCGDVNAPIIEKSALYSLDFNLFSDSYSNKSTCSGQYSDLKAYDGFFKVKLQPFGKLTLYLKSTGTSDDAIVYMFKDCNQVDNTCLVEGEKFAKGVSVPMGFNKSISYQAGANEETFYVSIDGTFLSDKYGRQIFFDIVVPECNPATYAPTCGTSNHREYCSLDGKVVTVDCTENGGTCERGFCTQAEANTCLSARIVKPVQGTPVVVNGSFASATSDYNLPAQNQCTGDVTPGQDRVYVVHLQQGDKLQVKAKSTETLIEDVAIYLATDCYNLDSACLVGSDAIGGPTSGDETISYTATAEGFVYVFIDSYYANNYGEYQLTFELN